MTPVTSIQEANAAHTATDLVSRVQVVGADGTISQASGGATAGAPTTATSVAATSSSAALIAANSSATYRLFVNVGADTVTIKLGTGTVTDYAGVVLPPNSWWDGTLTNGRFYTGALAVKTLTSTATVSVLEG